jgi:hypothetical protein
LSKPLGTYHAFKAICVAIAVAVIVVEVVGLVVQVELTIVYSHVVDILKDCAVSPFFWWILFSSGL